MADLTQILNRVEAGDSAAAATLIPLVYEELRQVAVNRMANEPADHTLQPTALVHEAWLRLGGDAQPQWRNRKHFFAAAAEAMRRILIDRARKKRSMRRGGEWERLDLDGVDIHAPAEEDEMLDLNEALERFQKQHPRKAELVKLRYFVGLSFEETATALGIAVPTAKQWWTYSRAWLLSEMEKPPSGRL